MIEGVKVFVSLPYTTVYSEAGKDEAIAAGTMLNWATVTRITGAIDLVPGDDYETQQGSPVQYSIWAGAATRNLAAGETIDVAVLQYGLRMFLVPLEELGTSSTNEWDVRVGILAWEHARRSQAYELHRPVVIDGSADDTAP